MMMIEIIIVIIITVIINTSVMTLRTPFSLLYDIFNYMSKAHLQLYVPLNAIHSNCISPQSIFMCTVRLLH